MANNEWHVKLSYGPRWITFFLGSCHPLVPFLVIRFLSYQTPVMFILNLVVYFRAGSVSIFMVLAFKILSIFQVDRRNRVVIRTAETRSEQSPLLSRKDDDLSSLGSSYDSISSDEEELDKWLGVGFSDGKQLEGETNCNPQLLCVICLSAPRDCFFLPCGHSSSCFTCGTRLAHSSVKYC